MIGRIDEISKKRLGLFFREKRKKLNFSQGEIAKQLHGISSQYISNVERGHAAYTLEQIYQLIRILKIEDQEVQNLINLELRQSFSRAWKNEISKNNKTNRLDAVEKHPKKLEQAQVANLRME